MRSLLFWFLNVVLVFSAQAQFNLGFNYFDEIPVIHNGDTLNAAWAGGLNNPHFSTIDIDMDGNDDVYAYDRDGGKVRTFLSDGNGNYAFYPKGSSLFPRLNKNFVLLRDYNNDGKKDLFSPGFQNNRLDIWRNTSDTILSFELAHDGLTYSRPVGSDRDFIFPRNDLPAIIDMDDDGDLDILLQGSYAEQGIPVGGVILYTKNLSQENSSNYEDVEYELEAKCWGKVREPPAELGWVEFDCDSNNINEGQRHGGPGTTLTPMDLNDDGLIDLLSGDSYSPRLMTLINTATNDFGEIDLAQSDTTFPSYDEPIYVPNVAAAFYEDIDQDGVKDLLVSPSTVSTYYTTFRDTSIHKNVDWFYRNNGTNSNPDFELIAEGYFSADMIDVGARSFPAMVDINGDGLLDLVVGGEGYKYYGGTVPAAMSLYLNVGSEDEAVFELVDEDFANVSEDDYAFAHPAFADLDDDDDFDMVIGDRSGRIHYYENKGTSTVYDFHLVGPNYSNIQLDEGAHPSFFDLNSDAVMDLIIGDYYGQIHYYENAGDPEEADFSQNATIEKMGDILLFHDFGTSTTPFFTRQLDSIGTNLYALLSSGEGRILVYGPIESIYDEWEISDSIVVEATQTSITGADLYGDFRTELIVGQRTGGLFILNREKEITVGLKERSSIDQKIEIFPNPTNGEVNIKPIGFGGSSTIQIIDLRGRIMLEKSVLLQANQSHQFSINDLSKGAYLVRISTNENEAFERLLIH